MGANQSVLFFTGLLIGMGIAFALAEAIMYRIMGWRK